MGDPVDYAELARQIMAYTKVNVTPKKADIGERMTVETIPGILPFLPSDLAGTLNLPVTGAVDVLLESLVKAVKFTVRYKVMVDGKELSSLTLEPLTPMSLPDSDPLLAMLRIPPLLVPEEKSQATTQGELIATVSLELEGNALSRDVSVPLEVVPIPFPTLFVAVSDPNDEDYPSAKIFMMARLGSAMQSASDAVKTLNTVIGAVNSVKDLLDLGTGFDLLLGGLTDTLALATKVGFTPVGLAIEEAPDLDDYSDFDDEARQSILIGPVGTKVTLYSGEDWNANLGGENERAEFVITEDFGAAAGVTTGFGVHRVSDWRNRMWDTDSGDNMDDVESCNFGESKEE
jgi:hypothetical protein